MSGFGEEVFRHVPATSAIQKELLNKTERTYVLTKNPVQDEGYVSNLELTVLEAGPIYVQVSTTTDKNIFLVRSTSAEPMEISQNVRGGEWYPENCGSRKFLFRSRNLGSICNESRSFVFHAFLSVSHFCARSRSLRFTFLAEVFGKKLSR